MRLTRPDMCVCVWGERVEVVIVIYNGSGRLKCFLKGYAELQ